jgi:hypothetical protein
MQDSLTASTTFDLHHLHMDSVAPSKQSPMPKAICFQAAHQ